MECILAGVPDPALPAASFRTRARQQLGCFCPLQVGVVRAASFSVPFSLKKCSFSTSFSLLFKQRHSTQLLLAKSCLRKRCKKFVLWIPGVNVITEKDVLLSTSVWNWIELRWITELHFTSNVTHMTLSSASGTDVATSIVPVNAVLSDSSMPRFEGWCKDLPAVWILGNLLNLSVLLIPHLLNRNDGRPHLNNCEKDYKKISLSTHTHDTSKTLGAYSVQRVSPVLIPNTSWRDVDSGQPTKRCPFWMAILSMVSEQSHIENWFCQERCALICIALLLWCPRVLPETLQQSQTCVFKITAFSTLNTLSPWALNSTTSAAWLNPEELQASLTHPSGRNAEALVLRTTRPEAPPLMISCPMGTLSFFTPTISAETFSSQKRCSRVTEPPKRRVIPLVPYSPSRIHDSHTHCPSLPRASLLLVLEGVAFISPCMMPSVRLAKILKTAGWIRRKAT